MEQIYKIPIFDDNKNLLYYLVIFLPKKAWLID